jgi:hypothetical protein
MQELDKILECFKEKNLQLDRFEKEYAKIVTQYLKAKPPFSWNRGKGNTNSLPLNQDEDFKKDVIQYQTLVFYSVMSGDREFKFLGEWGIDYPLKGCYRLARPLGDYLEAMQFLIDDEKNSEAEKKCYLYLYQKLTAKSSFQ